MNRTTPNPQEEIKQDPHRYSSNYCCAKFLLLFLALFMIGGVSAVQCNTTNNYINSSSISDGCTLNSPGIYTMSGERFNLNDTDNTGSIKIQTNNIVLNGNGSEVILINNYSGSNTPRGIQFDNYYNISIKNLYVNYFYTGIRMIRFSNVSIENVTFLNNFVSLTFSPLSNYNNSNLIIQDSRFYGNINSTGITYSWSNNIMSNLSIQNCSFFGNLSNYYQVGSIQNISLLLLKYNNYNIKYPTYDNGRAWTIKSSNNIILDNEHFFNGSNFNVFFYTNNVTLKNSRFYNNTAYNWLHIQDYNSNILIINNTFDLFDFAFWIRPAINISIINNTFKNAITNLDNYASGFAISGQQKSSRSSNIIISGNNFTNMGISCIILRQFDNANIFNNYCNTVPSNFYGNNYSSRALYTGNEPTMGFANVEVFRKYLGDSTDSDFDSLINVSYYNSTNVNYYNNTFGSNVQVPYRLMGVFNYTLDLQNYWYSAFNIFNLTHKDEFYISNNISCLYAFNPDGTSTNLLNQNYEDTWRLNYSICKTYNYFSNINDTNSIIINKFNLSSSLISLSNSTSYIASGDVNISLGPNNYTYVYDNFDRVTSYDTIVATQGRDTANSIYASLGLKVPTPATPYALSACSSAVTSFASYVALLGLVGSIILIGLALSYMLGIMRKDTFYKASIVSSIVTLILVGVLIVIAIFILSTLCAVF
jgi:hypothetical protein